MQPISLTLEALKTYLRVDHDEEDALIEGLLGAAIDYAYDFCGMDYIEELPEYVKQAIFMIAASWFEQREDFDPKYATRQQPVPTAAHRLLWLYKRVLV